MAVAGLLWACLVAGLVARVEAQSVLGLVNAPTLFEQHAARDFFAALSELGKRPEDCWKSTAPRWWVGGPYEDQYEARKAALVGSLVRKEAFSEFAVLFSFWPPLALMGHAYGQFLDIFESNLVDVGARLREGGGGLRMDREEVIRKLTAVFKIDGTIDLYGSKQMIERRLDNMIYDWKRTDTLPNGARRSHVTVCDFMREKSIEWGSLTRLDIEEARVKWNAIKGRLGAGANPQVLTMDDFKSGLCDGLGKPSSMFPGAANEDGNEQGRLEAELHAALCSEEEGPMLRHRVQMVTALWRVFNVDEHMTFNTPNTEAYWESYEMTPCEFQLAFSMFARRRFADAALVNANRAELDRTELPDHAWDEWFDLYTHSTNEVNRGVLKDVLNKDGAGKRFGGMLFTEFSTLLQGLSAREFIQTHNAENRPRWDLTKLFLLHHPERAIEEIPDAYGAYTEALYKALRCNPEKMKRTPITGADLASFYRHLEMLIQSDEAIAQEAVLYIEKKDLLKAQLRTTPEMDACTFRQVIGIVNDESGLVDDPERVDPRKDLICANWCDDDPLTACPSNFKCCSSEAEGMVCCPEGPASAQSALLVNDHTFPPVSGLYVQQAKNVFVNAHGVAIFFAGGNEWRIGWERAAQQNKEGLTELDLKYFTLECPESPCQLSGTHTFLRVLDPKEQPATNEWRREHLPEQLHVEVVASKNKLRLRQSILQAAGLEPGYLVPPTSSAPPDKGLWGQKVGPMRQSLEKSARVVDNVFLSIRCNPDYEPSREFESNVDSQPDPKYKGIQESDFVALYNRLTPLYAKSPDGLGAAVLKNEISEDRASRVMRHYVPVQPHGFPAEKGLARGPPSYRMTFRYFGAANAPYAPLYEGASDIFAILTKMEKSAVLAAEEQFHIFWSCLASFSIALTDTRGTLTRRDVLRESDDLDEFLFPEIQREYTFAEMLTHPSGCAAKLQDTVCLYELVAKKAAFKEHIGSDEVLAAAWGADSFCDALDRIKCITGEPKPLKREQSFTLEREQRAGVWAECRES